MSLKKVTSCSLIYLVFFACSLNDAEVTEVSTPLETSLTTVTTSPPVSESTTTSLLINTEECIGDNNFNINFEEIKNVQVFLNKYGFNAGEEDGYLGNQTITAIKEFQRYAGLFPDGDIGPITKDVMKSWTGCESEALQIATTTTTTTTISQSNESSIDDTTTTTTTTILENNETSYAASEFGYAPSISLLDNNLISIFKGLNNPNSICGTPYYNNLSTGIVNRYSNGESEILKIFNSPFIDSNAITSIQSITSNEIKITVNGNGDKNYNFYFVSPFSSKIISIKPQQINVSSGLTEGIFSKQSFSEGYWFYSFAENGTGEIVKSSGLREFAVNPTKSQFRDSQSGVELLTLTSNNQNVAYGGNLSTNDTIEISYLTNQI